MLVSRFLGNIRLSLTSIFHDKDWMSLWEAVLLPVGLPLLLGLGMSILLASFIVSGDWALVLGLLLLVPAVILFNTYPFAALLIWIAIMPFLQTTVTPAYRIAYWIVHRAMPVVALGIVVVANLLKVNKRRHPVRLGLGELAVVLFLGIAIVNILWLQSNPPPYLYLLYDRVFVPVCLFLLIRLVAPARKDLARLLPVAFFIVIVESIVGIFSHLTPQVLPPEWMGAQGTRGTGTLGFPHAYSTTLVFFAFFLLQDAMNRKPGMGRSIALFTVGLGAIGIFVSFSRGSWLGALIACLGLLVMYPKAMVRMMVGLLLIVSILGSGVLSDQMAYAHERMLAEGSAKDRLVIWDAGLQMVGAKPLFGWGYGDYSLYAGQFQRRVENYVAAYPHASHNAYLTIAAELGLPALFLFLFPVLWWLALTLKVWQRVPNRGFWSRSLLIVFWMVILDHVVASSFSDMRYSTFGQGMWWITLGLIANVVNVYLQPDDNRLRVWPRQMS